MKVIIMNIGGVNVKMTRTSQELMRVAKLWKRNAKAMLKRQGHVATGDLFKSMHPKLSLDKRGNPQVDLTPNVDYWQFVDQGVRGAGGERKTGEKEGQFWEQKAPKSPFKYTSKRPPLSAIQKWMKQKNIKPRDKGTGQFAKGTHLGLAFGIRESIFRSGLKPSYFITATQKRIEKRYAVPIALAYADDLVEAFINRLEDGNNY